jgi:hypothetical protein
MICVARFFLTQYTKTGKIYQIANKLPNGHEIYQMAVIYSKWPWNMSTVSIPRATKIYPKWDFWFENIPSGNPDHDPLTYAELA